MSNVAHELVALTRSEIEILAQRFLALRNEIDEILGGLATSRTAAPVEVADTAKERIEAPAMVSATQSTDEPAVVEDPAVRECTIDAEHQSAKPAAAEPPPLQVVASETCSANCTALSADDPMEAQRAAEQRGGASLLETPTCEPARAEGQPSHGKDLQPTPTAEVAPAREAEARVAVVLSLNPYRGIPKVPPSVRKKASPPVARAGRAFAVKLAACLIALVVAGSVMVDRDAWGSVHLPVRKKSQMPSQAQALARAAFVSESEHLKDFFEMKDFMPTDCSDFPRGRKHLR